MKIWMILPRDSPSQCISVYIFFISEGGQNLLEGNLTKVYSDISIWDYTFIWGRPWEEGKEGGGAEHFGSKFSACHA